MANRRLFVEILKFACQLIGSKSWSRQLLCVLLGSKIEAQSIVFEPIPQFVTRGGILRAHVNGKVYSSTSSKSEFFNRVIEEIRSQSSWQLPQKLSVDLDSILYHEDFWEYSWQAHSRHHSNYRKAKRSFQELRNHLTQYMLRDCLLRSSLSALHSGIKRMLPSVYGMYCVSLSKRSGYIQTVSCFWLRSPRKCSLATLNGFVVDDDCPVDWLNR